MCACERDWGTCDGVCVRAYAKRMCMWKKRCAHVHAYCFMLGGALGLGLKDILNLSFPVRKAGGSDFKTVHLLTPLFFFFFFFFLVSFSMIFLWPHFGQIREVLQSEIRMQFFVKLVWGHTKVVTVRRTDASFCKQKFLFDRTVDHRHGPGGRLCVKFWPVCLAT